MRVALALLVTIIAGSAIETAHADQYKWCAFYNAGRGGGATNCYFVTFAQCQAAVSGVGGFCMQSPYANVPATPPRKKKSG